MNKNETVKKYLNQLNIHMMPEQTLLELVILSYFAYKYKTQQEAYSSLCFDDFTVFKESALKASSSTDSISSSLIKDMVIRGTLHCGHESQLVYKELCELDEAFLIECMETAISMIGSTIQNIDTEKSIVDLMIRLSGNLNSVVNLCSGHGSILTEIYRRNKWAKLEGVEMNWNSSLISRLRLNIMGSDCRIWNEDLLMTRLNRQFMNVFCHYPWGQKFSGTIAEDHVGRMNYSTIKRGRMDWAFIIKALNCIAPNGKAFVLVPNGVLMSSVDIDTKKQMISKGYIQMIIELPSILIPGAASGFSLMVLSENNSTVDFIDAGQCLIKGNKGKELDVDKVIELVNNPMAKISVDPTTIEKHDYNLNYSEYRIRTDASGLINPRPLKELAEIITGYQYTSETLEEIEDGGKIKIVKMGDLGEYDLKTSHWGCDLDENKVQKYILKDRDILIQTKGSSNKMILLGKQDEKKIPHSNLSIIRCNEDVLLPEYFYLFLQGSVGENLLKKQKKGSIRVANISKSNLEELMIPVLDLPSQKAMISRYRELQEQKEQAEERLRKIEQQISDLYQDETERKVIIHE